ncbi:amino acid adenylation domain-containing protein [Leptothoe sp. EHU-05/26/07-4]
MNIENVQEIYALSPHQEGCLLGTRVPQFQQLYHSCYELQGSLNINQLQQAWQHVVDQHPTLRTSFAWKRVEQPLQIVRKQLKIGLQTYDDRSLSTTEQKKAIQNRLQACLADGLEPSQAPLLSLSLCQTDLETYQLLCVYHPLILDRTSLQTVLADLFVNYAQIHESQPQNQLWQCTSNSPYRDHITWIKQQNIKEAQEFWQRALAGGTAPPALGIEQVNGALPSEAFPYATQQRSLRPLMVERLYKLAQEHGLEVETLFQAGWGWLLHCYSGDEEITFGVRLSNQQTIVGPVLNTLPLRIKVLPDSASISSWLMTVERQRESLERYGYCSVEQVHQWGEWPDYTPLFNSTVAFYASAPEASASDLAIEGYKTVISPLPWDHLQDFGTIQVYEQVALHSETVPLALSVVSESAEPSVQNPQVRLHLTYACDRFTETTITNLLIHLETLLDGMLQNPQQPLGSLSLLTPADAQQILVTWNNTALDLARNRCIHRWFETQVTQNPDALAIVFQEQQLTYQELDQKANQLAHTLKAMGIGPEICVGLCVERSLEMIIGVLGILKAGGAYVPIDPTYPFERLSLIIDAVQPPVLLTQDHLVDNLPVTWGQVLCLDTDWDEISQASTSPLVTQVTPKNLAYIIFTSGSTGTPKGVLLEHQGVCNLAIAQQKRFSITTQSRVLQYASLSFDASVWEMVMALLAGATLVLAPREDLMPGPKLIALLQTQAVTLATFPPSVLTLLPAEDLPTLQTIIVAGEACSPDLIQRWAPQRSFFNAYGPTESTVCATVSECFPDTIRPAIGTPLNNVSCYLLDARLRPVPIGVPGELYIGGMGVARGYLNQPALTAERFIPNPFAHRTDQRLYKTGDLARYRPDGQIEFLGRLDSQVKLRGLRIELGEIEATLAHHPVIQDTVVLVHGDQPDEQRLVAYMVSGAASPPTSAELRQFLKEKLPEYMIPNSFIFLETFPLTPNGKVDRRSLPEPGQGMQPGQLFKPPRDRLELDLALLWSEILNVYPIGVQDDFFELGGHSLMAVSLMARIQQTMGKTLPLATLFQGATVEQQAAILRQELETQSWSPLVPLKPQGTKQPLYCVHPGGGRILAYLKLCQYLDCDRPLYGIEASGFQPGQSPQNQVEEMAKTYIEAIQTHQPEGPYLLAGWCLGGMIAYEIAQGLTAQGQTVAFLGLMDIYAPFATPETVPNDTELLLDFLGDNLTLSVEDFCQMTEEEQLKYAMEQAKRFDMLPPGISIEAGRCFLQVARSHAEATATYRPRSYTGEITLFQAQTGITAGTADLTQAWQTLTENVVLHWVPGDHRSMFRDPQVQVLAETLQTCLEPIN